MNAALRATLTTTPRPADADNTCVDRRADGSWSVCWWRQGHIKEPFGPTFTTAKEACAGSRVVREAVLAP